MVSTNMGGNDGITKLGKFVSLLCALLMVLTGVIHVFSEFQYWCSTNEFSARYVACKDSSCKSKMEAPVWETDTCFGPWLRFKVDNAKWTDDFNRVGYRDVFSFEPNKLVNSWTPTVFGFLSLATHMDGSRMERISGSWMRVFLWHIFAAFFGVFGFAGGWGVLVGIIMCPFACVVFLICNFLRPGADTTCGIAFGARSGNDGQFADAGGDQYHAQQDKPEGGGSYANASTVY